MVSVYLFYAYTHHAKHKNALERKQDKLTRGSFRRY